MRAADDKLGVVSHALFTYTLAGVDPDLDFYLVASEGEDECGSRSFNKVLEQNKEQLRADVIVFTLLWGWDSTL